jgi:hypothetical protein
MIRFIFLTVIITGILADVQASTSRVLFLGNSYTYVNNLPQIVRDLALSSGDTLIYDSNTIGGYTLDQHFLDSNSTNKIISGGWDYIIMQEQSQLPAFQDYTSNGPFNLCSLIHQYNPCARKLFYMTWGRKNGDAGNCPAWPPICTYEGMDSLLRIRYIEMAMLNNAAVAPAGAVWKYLRLNHPSIELYQVDESHPSEAGSYAAACSFYVSIFKKDPALLTYDFTLVPADAAIIRNAAKSVVFDSLAAWNFATFNPVAGFSKQIGPGTNEIILSNSSADANNFTWDFGDGSNSTDTNSIHSYSSNGTFTILLTAFSCDLDSVYHDDFSATVTFCSHNPSVTPDSLLLCLNYSDSLFTQPFDSYQWFESDTITILNATQPYFVPFTGGNYSVIATQNNCSEMSPQVNVILYSTGLIIYHVDSAGIFHSPDTACEGDTVLMILNSNKPRPSDHAIHWFRNGQAATSSIPDTMFITTSGQYCVSVSNPYCQQYEFYKSDTFNLTFIDCNNDINENEHEKFTVFPVPSQDYIKVNLNPDYQNITYFITNIIGEKIQAGSLVKDKCDIDIGELSNGIFFLHLSASSAIVKFIKY